MSRAQTPLEERLNSLSHAVGGAIGLAGLTTMLWLTHGAGWLAQAAVLTYGLCLVGLFSASAVYHWVEHPVAKRRLQKVDHCAIYLMIAGSYTPFTLLVIGGWVGWTMFAAVWLLAIAGLGQDLPGPRRERLALGLYLVMGWLVLLAIQPLWAALSAASLALLVLGGLLYTGGVWFYVRDRPYDHTIWHGFVLGGAASHAVAVTAFLL